MSNVISEAQHLHLAGVQLIAGADDHESVGGECLLNRFGVLDQLFDGACNVYALEILIGFELRFVRLPDGEADGA